MSSGTSSKLGRALRLPERKPARTGRPTDPFLAFLSRYHKDEDEESYQETVRHYRLGYAEDGTDDRMRQASKERYRELSRSLFPYAVNQFLKTRAPSPRPPSRRN